MSGSADGLERDWFARSIAKQVATGRDPASSLCTAGAEALGVSGAGLILVSRGRSLGCVGASDSATEAVEQLEYTLNEGPCLDACRTRAPVVEADLGHQHDRWPAFGPAASAAAVRAAFGFPLLVGRVCIGALNLYQHDVGDLTTGQFADALVVADVASRTILDWQEDSPPGVLAWQLEEFPNHRAQVHQATGRISAQAGVSVVDAQALLRAYAFAHDRLIFDVAREVASGQLRFD